MWFTIVTNIPHKNPNYMRLANHREAHRWSERKTIYSIMILVFSLLFFFFFFDLVFYQVVAGLLCAWLWCKRQWYFFFLPFFSINQAVKKVYTIWPFQSTNINKIRKYTSEVLNLKKSVIESEFDYETSDNTTITVFLGWFSFD